MLQMTVEDTPFQILVVWYDQGAVKKTTYLMTISPQQKIKHTHDN